MADKTGVVKKITKNDYGLMFDINIEGQTNERFFLNKTNNSDPTLFNLNFLIGKIVSTEYWITNRGYNIIKALGFMDDDKEFKTIYANDIYNIPDKYSYASEAPKYSESNKVDKDELYYLKELYFQNKKIISLLEKAFGGVENGKQEL